jgi:hypothetical protein
LRSCEWTSRPPFFMVGLRALASRPLLRTEVGQLLGQRDSQVVRGDGTKGNRGRRNDYN